MLEPSKKYYLYSHIRLDKNEVFYIGVGSKPPHYTIKCYKRALSKYSRNRFWWFVANKTDYRVEILEESEDYEYIKRREIELIKFYGRKNLGTGSLCNLTDGGDYKCGYKQSPETIERIRIASTGRLHTEEAKDKLRQFFYKPVIMKNERGEIVEEYAGVILLVESCEYSRSCIDKCIKLKRPIQKGRLAGYTFELKKH